MREERASMGGRDNVPKAVELKKEIDQERTAGRKETRSRTRSRTGDRPRWSTRDEARSAGWGRKATEPLSSRRLRESTPCSVAGAWEAINVQGKGMSRAGTVKPSAVLAPPCRQIESMSKERERGKEDDHLQYGSRRVGPPGIAGPCSPADARRAARRASGRFSTTRHWLVRMRAHISPRPALSGCHCGWGVRRPWLATLFLDLAAKRPLFVCLPLPSWRDEPHQHTLSRPSTRYRSGHVLHVKRQLYFAQSFFFRGGTLVHHSRDIVPLPEKSGVRRWPIEVVRAPGQPLHVSDAGDETLSKDIYIKGQALTGDRGRDIRAWDILSSMQTASYSGVVFCFLFWAELLPKNKLPLTKTSKKRESPTLKVNIMVGVSGQK